MRVAAPISTAPTLRRNILSSSTNGAGATATHFVTCKTTAARATGTATGASTTFMPTAWLPRSCSPTPSRPSSQLAQSLLRLRRLTTSTSASQGCVHTTVGWPISALRHPISAPDSPRFCSTMSMPRSTMCAGPSRTVSPAFCCQASRPIRHGSIRCSRASTTHCGRSAKNSRCPSPITLAAVAYPTMDATKRPPPCSFSRQPSSQTVRCGTSRWPACSSAFRSFGSCSPSRVAHGCHPC